jgi:hypothetical protein
MLLVYPEMIFAYAQLASNQFLRMLSQGVTNFRACSAEGEIPTHFKIEIQNMLSIRRKKYNRWLSIRRTYFIAG